MASGLVGRGSWRQTSDAKNLERMQPSDGSLVRIHRRVAATPRLFICLSGRPKPMASESSRYRSHWKAVMRGLIDHPRADLFAHLDGTYHSDAQLHSAAEALGARRVVIYRNTTDTAQREQRDRVRTGAAEAAAQSLVAWKVGTCEQPARRSDWGECLSAGYEQSVKWRGCWRDLLAEERDRRIRYEFVLRVRPDLEFSGAFPPLEEWRCLRTDMVWSMISMTAERHSTWCRPEKHKRISRLRDPTDKSRFLEGASRPLARDNTHLDDSLALMPRRAAEAYFAVADEYERCIPLTPANGLCGNRWGWPECRIVQALARASGPPLQRAELPGTRAFSIIDCNRLPVLPGAAAGDLRRVLGENHTAAACEAPRRRKREGLSALWQPIWCGAGTTKKWCVPFCACTEVPFANFSSSSYDSTCLTPRAHRSNANLLRPGFRLHGI